MAIGCQQSEHFKEKKEVRPAANAFYGGEFVIDEKAVRKLKGRKYKIKSPIVEWGEKEIAIEIHCDSGEILTKADSRAKIGICGFF